ncbi:MAG TPA: hypothetical protein VEF04_00775 [Blastocatellia bacterium]|nr:hypothetical protein [Blastocatellia bacterium]
MTPDEKKFCRGIDGLLKFSGYKRHPAESCWTSGSYQGIARKIYLEFSKGFIKVTIGLDFVDLESYLPPEAVPVTRTLKNFSSICPHPQNYHIAERHGRLALDLFNYAGPFLRKLSDHDLVIKLLKRKSPASWPTNSYSDRVRLLPLLIAHKGQIEEACNLVKEFLAEIKTNNKPVPEYETFARAFAERFGCNF